MLEIVALIFLWKQMGAMLRLRGWKNTVWMQVLTILTYFIGALFGGIGYGIYAILTKGPHAAETTTVGTYVCVVVAAVLAELLLFGIVYLFPGRPAVEPPSLDKTDTSGPTG